MGQREILEVLQQGGTYSPKQLAEILGVNYKSINICVVKLRHSHPIKVERVKAKHGWRIYYSYNWEAEQNGPSKTTTSGWS